MTSTIVPGGLRVIGLAGLEHLAEPLRRAGFEVHSGPTFTDSVAAIRAALAGEQFPILALAAADPGLADFVDDAVRQTRVAVVAATPDTESFPSGVAVFPNDVTVNQAWQRTGWFPAMPSTTGDLQLAPIAPERTGPAASPQSAIGEQSVDPQPDDLLGAFGEPRHARRRGYARRVDLADVIVPMSGKGGAGKTTLALAIAKAAAEGDPALRVVLIDANRGQGDVRTYLRIPDSAMMPSMYDLAIGRQPADVLIAPERLAEARPRLPRVGFATVLAPEGRRADPRTVTSAMYRDVIDHARTVSDLVVIDTQIMESVDTSGLIDEVMLPVLASTGGYALALTDETTAGAKNLLARLGTLREANVPLNRTLVIFNKTTPEIDTAELAEVFGRRGVVIGEVPMSTDVRQAMQTGAIDLDDSALEDAVRAVLYRILGTEQFAPRPSVEPAVSWWRKLLAGRKSTGSP